jgi:hypothetical protein
VPGFNNRSFFPILIIIFNNMISRNLKQLTALITVGTIAAYVVLVTIPMQMTKRGYDADNALGIDFKRGH